MAARLRESEIGPGDIVALWLSDGADKIAAILGCWQVGAAFCVLPAFAGNTKTERSQGRIANVFSVLSPKLLLQGQDVLPEDAHTGVPSVFLPGIDDFVGGDPVNLTDIDPKSLAFIQFTSGSTGGAAKGAMVHFHQLSANLTALAKRTGMDASDHMVSWAPLYHDMGLMAVLLSLHTGAKLTLMETDHFVRRPSAWLEAISNNRGTVTTGPPTALKLLTRRRATNVDLSTLRYAWIGGEAVFPTVARNFEAAYSEAGLKPGVIQPTYGMAETVVGVSCGIPNAPWASEDGVISCGPVLEGMEVHPESSGWGLKRSLVVNSCCNSASSFHEVVAVC